MNSAVENAPVIPTREETDDISTTRLKSKLTRELGMLRPYLDQDDVQEIFVNGDGKAFVVRAGCPKEFVGYMSSDKIDGFLASVASSLHTTITRSSPTIDGMLIIDGSRISGEIPPIVKGPSMRIRKTRENRCRSRFVCRERHDVT